MSVELAAVLAPEILAERPVDRDSRHAVRGRVAEEQVGRETGNVERLGDRRRRACGRVTERLI
jgi:hypothetical protein